MPTLIVTTKSKEIIEVIKGVLDEIPGDEIVEYNPEKRPANGSSCDKDKVEIGYVICDNGNINWACADDDSPYQIFHALVVAYASC